MIHQRISISLSDTELVSAIVSMPDHAGRHGLTVVPIAHGAGNDMNHPLLADVADLLTSAGYVALRFNFPYAEKGHRAPDREEVLARTWQCVFQYLREESGIGIERIIAAGKSMGGRIASWMIAEQTLPVDGLVLLGYPLHPAGDKERIRDEHLYRIRVPMLFFAGTRDPLCDLGLLRPVIARLGPLASLEVIEGGNHSFEVPKSYGITARGIHEKMAQRMIPWLDERRPKDARPD